MKFIQTSLLAVVLSVPGAVCAGDIGELTAQCDSCHGVDGASTSSDVPIIGGQSAGFITSTLESFQDWGRPCIKSAYRSGDTTRPKIDMCKIAGGLSNEDIAALSAHYSDLPWVPAKQDFDAVAAEAGAVIQRENCESCHYEGGKGLGGLGPRLAGQWKPYMKATLKFVPTGEHLVPPAMEKSVADFSDADINAVLNFYASQQD
jgi:sulfide dehydrogenase cytochrome subunit